MADMVAPSLAGPCLDERLLSVSRRDGGFAGVQAGPDGPQLVPIEPYVPSRGQWLLTNLASILNPFELSARILMGELGVPVLAVESDPENHHIKRAKDYGIPIVLGRGGSRFLLRRLCLGRARALAAVTSDEIENISVAVAAHAMRHDLRTLLRAGRGDVVNETSSLFKIGLVRDVYRIGGTLIAAAALGSPVAEAFLHEKTVYLIGPDGRIEPFDSDVEAARSDEGVLSEVDA